MTLIIYGEPATKKNSSQIIHAGGTERLIPSRKYREYERTVRLTIPPEARRRIATPVNVKAIYYRKTRRRVDISNLHSALHDALVAAGVLEDDNRDIVAATDGSRVYHDPDNPRTEVTITPLEDPDYELFSAPRKRVKRKRSKGGNTDAIQQP